MNFQLRGRITTFGNTARGGIIRYATGPSECLGMKVSLEERQGRLRLSPAGGQYANKPYVIWAQQPDWESEPVFELEAPIARATDPVGGILLAPEAAPAPGDMIVSEDRVFLSIVNGEANGYVDLATGELAAQLRLSKWAVMRSWSLIQIVDDRPRTLYERKAGEIVAHKAEVE
jgi:hypothetical protein